MCFSCIFIYVLIFFCVVFWGAQYVYSIDQITVNFFCISLVTLCTFNKHFILCFSVDQYSFHINCGGEKITIGNIDYEADNDQGGETKYLPTGSKWEVSSTGHFWDKNITSTDYIAHNVSVLKMNDSDIYTTARLSPLSLTYYLRCLGNGNYTVKLHFAEIVIRDNRSFYSLGRRVFDVYIQVLNHVAHALLVPFCSNHLIQLVCCRGYAC